jgi:hypothetical protein
MRGGAAMPLVGMTYDRVGGDYVAPVSDLSVKPAVRICFDPGTVPAHYARAIKTLAPVAYIMGQPVDSSEVKATPLSAYAKKFKTFLAAFPNLDIWEVGNELNGEWLGGKPYTSAVGVANPPVAKAYDAYREVHAAGGASALTLYYEPPQTVTPGYEMVTWAQKNFASLPDMATGLNYVLVSYYEVDNKNIRPTQAQWSTIFTQLHAIFPNAKLGFGEIGLNRPFDKQSKYTLAHVEGIMDYYYTLAPALPRGTQWAGGEFWWYAAEDFEPTTRPLYAYFRSIVGKTR